MDLPHPGIELGSPALQVDSLPAELSGKVGIVPQSRSNHGKKGLLRFCLHYWLSALLEPTCLCFFSSSFTTLFLTLLGFPGGSDGKALACNSGDSSNMQDLVLN